MAAGEVCGDYQVKMAQMIDEDDDDEVFTR